MAYFTSYVISRYRHLNFKPLAAKAVSFINDARDIKLSNHGIRFRYRLATESLIVSFEHVSNQRDRETSNLTFANYSSHTDIRNSLKPIQLYHLFCGIWHSLILAHNNICHCYTIDRFHFFLV